MADTDIDSAKDYQVDVPVSNEPFFLKGSNHLDWGIKNRLSQIFNPVSGRTVMLAFDHGYFKYCPFGTIRRHFDVDSGHLTYFDSPFLSRRYRIAV